MTMKFISPLVILVFAVAKGNIFEDGMEYTFDTESSAVVGTMDHSPHSSGYSYKYQTRMQVHGDSIKFPYLSDVRMSQFNGKHEAGGYPFENTNFLDANKDMPPFEVKLDSYETSSKVLFKSFQLNKDVLNGHGHGLMSEEASIFGDLAHTKDCKNRVHVLIDDWKGYRCNIDPTNPESRENPNGLYSASNTVFIFEKKGDRLSPKAIVGSSSLVAQFFGSEGVSYIAHSNSTSILKKVQSSPGDIAVSGETITDLKYEFEDKEYTWKSERDLKAREKNLASGEFFEDEMSNIAEFVKKRFDKVAFIFNEMSTEKSYTSKAHYYGLNNIYPAMVEMDYSALKSLAEQLQADKSDEGVRKNNLFNELLGSLGTSASAILIRDMVVENKFDNYRDAVRVLTAVPFHIRHPNVQLLDEYEKLYSFEGHQLLKDSLPLILGHLARVTCERAGVPHSPASKECFTSVVDKYTEKHFQKKSFVTSDHVEQVKIMGMLFNLRYGNLADKLKPIIFGETDIKCGQLRTLALEASAWGAISNGKGAEEHDYEVINFAFSLFEKYSLNIDPCLQKVSSLAKYFLKYLKQYSDFQTSYGIGISKTYARQFYQRSMDIVVLLIIGLSDLTINYAFGCVNVRLSKTIVHMNIKARPDQPLRVEFRLSVKGSLVALRQYDEDSIKEGGTLRNLFEDFKSTGDSYSINHQRAIRMGSLLYQQPLENGESKKRVFMDHTSDVTGSYLYGEYFDCELPSSRGRVLYHLWKAMMPYNKSPRTFAEKCGAMMRWSQSKDKPVREIEITMRATAGPNGEKLFFKGRKWAITTIVKAKGEPEDRIYKFIIGHEFTPGYLENTLKVSTKEKESPESCLTTLCLSGKAKVQYGPHEDFGNSAPGEIRITFEHATTEEAREDMKNTWYYQKCMEQKNLPSWQGRGDLFPQTEACFLTVWDATTARKYSYKIDFVKMTDRMNAICISIPKCYQNRTSTLLGH
ncbi:unnamed protein product [Lepeophtheirus salmonis]|uniref:(salmon louse) hypothetical protein n=1 Tax=Lepeophtheirus salmonis TaxID=72036 RepID=A0A7R8D3V0_LEPSM|nr:unnamed protein product [Lepeophtheirus salmonis]CAF3017748.1 unnamed protein product [Lepeophtheirus salmonis]